MMYIYHLNLSETQSGILFDSCWEYLLEFLHHMVHFKMWQGLGVAQVDQLGQWVQIDYAGGP